MTRLATVDQLLRKALAVLDASGTPDGFNNLGGVISWIKSLSASVSNGLRSILKSCFCRIAVTGRKDHRQIGIPRTDFSRKPDSVDGPWHDDIAEDEIDLRTGFKQF